MGTWDTGSFDNDTAADWSYELEKSSDLSVIEAAFDRVLEQGPEREIRADCGERAVAAADTLARLLGQRRDSDAYTDAVDAWVGSHKLTPSPER